MVDIDKVVADGQGILILLQRWATGDTIQSPKAKAAIRWTVRDLLAAIEQLREGIVGFQDQRENMLKAILQSQERVKDLNKGMDIAIDRYEDEAIDNIAREATITELQQRVKELEGKAELAEWARHDEGCCYPFNEKYGCRCGLLTALEALPQKDGD